jgi:hypothetical protein
MALVTGLFVDVDAITMGTETPWGQKHHGDRKAIETVWLRAK